MRDDASLPGNAEPAAAALTVLVGMPVTTPRYKARSARSERPNNVNERTIGPAGDPGRSGGVGEHLRLGRVSRCSVV